MTNNTHFHPEIYVPIPTDLLEAGLVTLQSYEELPIYSNTALDEIQLRIPDALFNGQAVVNLIENCIPNISDAWLLPNTSLNYLLAAIRIATNGENMELSVTCPKCKEEDNYSVQLTGILDSLSNIKVPEPIIPDSEMTVHFRSINYKELTAFNIRHFSNQKGLAQLKNLNVTEQESLYNSLLDDTTELNNIWISSHIKHIIYDNKVYSKFEDISQILSNCDRKTFEVLKKIVSELSAKLAPKMGFKCSSCEHEFTLSLNLDYCQMFRQSIIDKDEAAIRDVAEQYEKEIGIIKKDLVDCMWHMRGSMSYAEILRLSHKERKIISKMVDEHIKVTKESKQPFF